MSSRVVLLRVLAVLAGIVPTSTAQVPWLKGKKPPVSCRFCGNHGYKPCRRHDRREFAWMQAGVSIFCSESAGCAECGGALFVDCPHCSAPEIEAALAARRKKARAWLAARRKRVEGLIRHRVLQAASKHFELVCDLKPMTVGRVRYSTHMLLHLYLERLERLYASFVETLELPAGKQPDRCEIFLWRDGRDQALAAQKFCEMGSSGTGVKLMGAKSVYTMFFQRRYLRNDKDLHRNVVHNTAHLLLAGYPRQNWIGKLKGGWVDAGVAHYFEFKLDGKCTNYCYNETANEIDFKGGKWLVPVRKMLFSRKRPSFAEVSRKNTDQLDPKEHALSFSWVHYLLEGDLVEKHRGRRFTAFVDLLKRKRPLREAMQKVYGIGPLAFEERWRAWVLKTYPAR